VGAILRHPLLHFALVGSLLFVVSGSGIGRDTGATSAPRVPLEISAARIRKAEVAFSERVGRPSAPADRAALVRELVDEEILYREALRLGLDHGDSRVEERLLRKMKIVSRDPDASRAALLEEARVLGIDRSDPLIRRMQVEAMKRLLRRDPAAQISDEALVAAVSEEERRVRKPEAITFSQVYLGPDLPPDHEWTALRSRLADPRLAPRVSAEFGRPLPVGGTLRAQSYRRLAGQFDADFAERVFEIDSGLWSAPVRSPYGYHLVFVHEVLGERLVDRALLRERALRRISRDRAEARLEASLDWLRSLYSVRIEDAETASGGGHRESGS